MRIATFVCIASFVAAGCGCGTKKNPAYDYDAGTDSDVDTDVDSDTDTDVDSDSDTDTDSDSDSDSDTDTDTDTGPCLTECCDAAECEPLLGVAPCGAWECNGGACEVACPGCTDLDRDGFGPEVGVCAGPDCNDGDDTVFDSVAPAACYSGPGGTDGVGTCHAGTQSCDAGLWTPCVGEVVPSGEACNDDDDDCDGSVDDDLGDFGCGIGACARTVPACAGGAVGVCVAGAAGGTDDDCDGVDDNCNGAVDEQCFAACVWVSGAALPGGCGGVRDGSTGCWYADLQSAIDVATPDGDGVDDFVCVAADNDADCFDFANFGGPVSMKDGVNVYGSYRQVNTSVRCQWTTQLTPGIAEGVEFDDTISATTVLDGFRIVRANLATSTGITIDGATNVIISDVRMGTNLGAAVVDSYGIDLQNGAEATITRCHLTAGNGTGDQVTIRSVGSTPTITNNCQDQDGSGRCDSGCAAPWRPDDRGLAARNWWDAGSGGARAYVVQLVDSPGAIVESSALCEANADDGAGVRIDGDANGVVIRGNLVTPNGGDDNSHGIWMEDCGGAAPWIVDNWRIVGEGDQVGTLVDGIRAVGDCHPVIDSNREIGGGGEGGTSSTNGVYCGTDGVTASQCVVLGNLSIRGSLYGHPPVSVGVRCDDDACMRIADNVIDGNGGVDVYGLWLSESGTFVDDNVITGGCGIATSTGLYSDDSFARVQNNRISAGTCPPGGIVTPNVRAMHVWTAAGVNEIDVHSNVIDGAGNAGNCTSYGVDLDVVPGAAPAAGVGIFRNNVVRGGVCNTAAYDFFESDATADPRIFESNDLDSYSTPTDLYYDEGASGLDLAADVDALVDMTVSGTLSVDPSFVSYGTGNLHLNAGSPCDGAGTPNGAPALDMDGDVRDLATPDIGPDEI